MKRLGLFLAVTVTIGATFIVIISIHEFVELLRTPKNVIAKLKQVPQDSSMRDDHELQRVVNRKVKERDPLAWLPERTGLYHYKLILPAVEHDETIEEAQALVSQTERTSPHDLPALARAINRLAVAYHKRHRYAEAEPLYRRVLSTELAADADERILAMKLLAMILFLNGRMEEGEELHQAILKVWKPPIHQPSELEEFMTLGFSSSTTFESIHEPVRVFATTRKQRGDLHMATSLAALALGEYFLKIHWFVEAMYMFDQALSGAQMYDEAAMRAAEKLGQTSLAVQDVSRAIKAYEKLLVIQEKRSGPKSGEVAVTCMQLAWISERLQQNENAKQFYERALSIKSGPTWASQYVGFLQRTGRQAEAKEAGVRFGLSSFNGK